MKKLFALLLSAVLLLGLLPLNALAATSSEYDCPRCGAQYFVPENGYSLEPEPTCTEKGRQIIGYCRECGTVTVDVPALGHDWNYGTIGVHPTCTETGIQSRVCVRCKIAERVEIGPLGHDWGPWELVRPATPQEEGLERCHCQRDNCDAQQTRPVPYEGPVPADIHVEKGTHRGPQNGMYYTLGEDIIFNVTIQDVKGRECMQNVFVVDPLVGYTESNPHLLGDEDGEYFLLSVALPSYKVTEEDVARGYVENTAELRWNFVSEQQQYSATTNTLRVPVGREWRVPPAWNNYQPYDDEDEGTPQTVSFEKYLLKGPANGTHFVLGEAVGYKLVAYLPEVYDLQNIAIYDVLAPDDAALATLPTQGDTTQFSTEFWYTVTQEDVARGYIENYGKLTFTSQGDAYTVYSNVLTVDTGAGESVGAPTITKTCISNPANGLYFVQGEYVLFDVTLTNPANGQTLKDITIWDFLLNAEATYYEEDTSLKELKPGEKYITTFSMEVTEFDVERGSIDNSAGASYLRADGTKVNTETVYESVPTGENTALNYDVFVRKDVQSSPANGMYYTVGEEILYSLEVVNKGTLPLHDVILYDFGTAVGALPYLDAGKAYTYHYLYTVNDYDALCGAVYNTATLIGRTAEQAPYSTTSNEVIVATGYAPFGVITEMTAEKRETSTPQNGTYYTKGETIEYEITVRNTGETTFYDNIVYDALQGYAQKEIAYAEMLHSGETRTYTFAYEVTAADVEAGCVVNKALVHALMEGNFAYTAISNTVISDTDGEKDLLPPAGHIDLEDDDFDGKSCVTTLVRRGDGSWEYSTEFCKQHQKTHDAVEKLLREAQDEEETYKQLQRAKELWKLDIEEMYETLSKHADSVAKLVILEDQVTFFDLVESQEQLLLAAEPEARVQVATHIVDMLQAQCYRLCYDMHNAPDARTDVQAACSDALNLPHGEVCLCEQQVKKDDTLTTQQSLCTAHVELAAVIEVLHTSQKAARAWAGASRLWTVEIESGIRSLSQRHSKAMQAGINSYYRALQLQLRTHEKLLGIFYAGNSAVQDEVMSNLKRDAVMEICCMTPMKGTLVKTFDREVAAQRTSRGAKKG